MVALILLTISLLVKPIDTLKTRKDNFLVHKRIYMVRNDSNIVVTKRIIREIHWRRTAHNKKDIVTTINYINGKKDAQEKRIYSF